MKVIENSNRRVVLEYDKAAELLKCFMVSIIVYMFLLFFGKMLFLGRGVSVSLFFKRLMEFINLILQSEWPLLNFALIAFFMIVVFILLEQLIYYYHWIVDLMIYGGKYTFDSSTKTVFRNDSNYCSFDQVDRITQTKYYKELLFKGKTYREASLDIVFADKKKFSITHSSKDVNEVNELSSNIENILNKSVNIEEKRIVDRSD